MVFKDVRGPTREEAHGQADGPKRDRRQAESRTFTETSASASSLL